MTEEKVFFSPKYLKNFAIDLSKLNEQNKRNATTPPVSPRIKLTEFREIKKIIGSDCNPDDVEILRELGHGNGSVVVELLHGPSKIVLVRKAIELSLRPSLKAQIMRELQFMHDINSQFVIGFYGVSTIEGQLLILLESMDMGPVNTIVYDHAGRFPEDAILHIFRCVVQGLVYLRSQHNITHKNLKPTNILLNSAGEVRLSDPVISTLLAEEISSTNICIKCYLDPCRIKGEQFNSYSDIWSLGVILMELALGTFPYPCPTLEQYAHAFKPNADLNIQQQNKAMLNGEPLPAVKSSWHVADKIYTLHELLDLLITECPPRLPGGCFSAPLTSLIHACLKDEPTERIDLMRLSQSPCLAPKTDEQTAAFVRYLKLLTARKA